MKPTIFPVIRYADASAAMDWLGRAFGFHTQATFAGPDGSVAHAEVRLGAGAIAVSSATPAVEGNPWSRVRQGIYACIEDVDAHHDRAKRAGADVLIAPRDTPYGSREYCVRDPDGHLWSFGTYAMGADDGEPNIFPELRYPSGAAATEWLVRAFGFEVTEEAPGPTGVTVHAELQLAGSTIMASVDPGAEAYWGQRMQAISAYVADPDAHHACAQSAGALVTQPPNTTHYGARAYWAQDPEGFLWGFSTYRPARKP
jgi:uncharacterized glyoxalase superfamily protein PhnB